MKSLVLAVATTIISIAAGTVGLLVIPVLAPYNGGQPRADLRAIPAHAPIPSALIQTIRRLIQPSPDPGNPT